MELIVHALISALYHLHSNKVIIMPINSDMSESEIFNAVVVAQHYEVLNDSAGGSRSRGTTSQMNFVIVTLNDGVVNSCSQFNSVVVPIDLHVAERVAHFFEDIVLTDH